MEQDHPTTKNDRMDLAYPFRAFRAISAPISSSSPIFACPPGNGEEAHCVEVPKRLYGLVNGGPGTERAGESGSEIQMYR